MKINTTKRLLSAFLAVMFAVTMLGGLTAFAAPEFGGFGVDQDAMTPGQSQTTTPPSGGIQDGSKDVIPSVDPDKEQEDVEVPDFGGFRPEGGNIVIMNAPEDKDLGGMEVSAYQILTESTDYNGYKDYRVTADFADFFNREGFGTIMIDPMPSHIYITYSDGMMQYSTELPKDDSYIRLSKADVQSILIGDFFEASLLSKILGEGKNGITTNAKDAQTLSDWLRDYVKTNNITPGVYKKAKAGDSQVKLSDLDDGYWFILSENAPAGVANVKSVLKTTDGGVYTMDLKAEYPKLEKTVANNGASYDDGNSALAGVGDVLDYNVTFEAQDMSEYTAKDDKGNSKYTFKIHDKMTNQKLSPSYLSEDTNEKYPYNFSVTFKEFGQSVTFVDLTRNQLEALDVLGDYYPLSMILKSEPTINGNEDEFTLEFDVAKLQKLWTNNLVEAKFGKNVTIVVEYKAELTSDAVLVNGNDVKIEYSNDPKAPENTVDEEDKTTVYSYGLDLEKKFSDEDGTFADVVFNLYKAEQSKIGDKGIFDGTVKVDEFSAPVVSKDGDAIEFVYDTKHNIYNQADSDDENTTIELTPGKDGKLRIYGLAPGYYILEEVATSEGYKLADKIIIYIADDGTISHGLKVPSSAAWEGSTYVQPDVEVIRDNDDEEIRNFLSFEILNQKGFNLPGTGGIGVWLFSIGGVLLIAAAAYIFASQKKRDEA